MINKCITQRRSIRKFSPLPPTKDIILELIRAATAAPSASNKQPWRFIVLGEKDVIQAAAQAVEKRCQELLQSMDPRFTEDFRQYSAHFTSFKSAPTIILPIYRPIKGFSHTLHADAPQSLRQRMEALEDKSSLASISMACQNLMLAAESMQLGTCYMTGPLVAEDTLRELFKIPQSWNLAGLMALGYPTETPPSPGRKPVESVVKWIPEET